MRSLGFRWAYLSGEEGHGGAVDPGVVSRGRHALQVILSLRRGDAGAGQLTVIHGDFVTLHCLLHGNQSICKHHICIQSLAAETKWTMLRWAPTCGHLVSEASAAAVDHHAHLAFVVDAHLLGGVVVVDLIHHLDLGIVVSCSQGAELQHANTHGGRGGLLQPVNDDRCEGRGSCCNTCGRPLFLALEDTLLGSACSIRPYSSQCSLSSAQA